MGNVIKINIKKKEDYVSKFSDDILSSELSNYIMEECHGYDLNGDIRIEITSEYVMNEDEKNKLINMIRVNFLNEINELYIYRQRSIILDFLILGFGILALIFYIFSSNIAILSEIILVFSWVLIWESLYNLIFGGFNNKIDIQRKRNIANCKIIFK